MAVAFDAVGGGNSANAIASPLNITWSHTSTGSNRCVVLGYSATSTGGAYTTHTRTMTYDGVAMTSLGGIHANNDTARPWIEFFYLLNQSTGAKTVSLTLSKTSANLYARANSVSYTGVGSVGTLATTSGVAGTSASQTISSATGNMVSQGFMVQDSSAALSAYSQTSRYNFGTDAAAAATILIGDAAGSASVSFTATKGSGLPWAGIGVDVQAALAGNANLFFSMF